MIENEPINLSERIIHDFEFVLILKGQGRYKILDKKIDYFPGSLIFTPPYIIHEYFGKDPVSYYYLHFDFANGFSKRFMSFKKVLWGYSSIRFEIENHAMPFFSEKIGLKFRSKLLSTIEFQNNPFRLNNSSRPLIQKTLLMDLITEWFSECADNNIGSDITPFAASLNIMHGNMFKSIKISELAKKEGLSEQHYIVKFRKLFKQTPIKYLNSIRIQRAQEMMRNPKTKLCDIALATGFSDPLYFSRVFHNITGAAPRDFRKRLMI